MIVIIEGRYSILCFYIVGYSGHENTVVFIRKGKAMCNLGKVSNQ